MISVHFKGKPFSVTVIQVYALTSNTEEAEAERFYDDLQDLLELTPKKDVLFITGDWNAKVGSQEIPGVTGKSGLGVQNEAGQRPIEFCQENTQIIENTLFQQHKRRLYKWTSPEGEHQNQIDYILCSHRWRSSIESAKTRPGADCGSDGGESACDAKDPGSIPGLRRAPGGGRGNPLQCSCLENPRDRGAWRATVHGVASRTQVSD